MGAIDALSEITNVGFSEVFKTVMLFIVAVLLIWEAFEKLTKRLGKTHRELKDENIDSRLKELDDKINNNYKEINERIDGMCNNYNKYHAESIHIRDGLSDKQNEIVTAITSITELLNEMKKDQLDEKVQRMRWQILEVANYIRNKEDVNMEQLNNALDTYDDYERVLDANKLKNGQVDVSIQLIREKKLEIMHGED